MGAQCCRKARGDHRQPRRAPRGAEAFLGAVFGGPAMLAQLSPPGTAAAPRTDPHNGAFVPLSQRGHLKACLSAQSYGY